MKLQLLIKIETMVVMVKNRKNQFFIVNKEDSRETLIKAFGFLSFYSEVSVAYYSDFLFKDFQNVSWD